MESVDSCVHNTQWKWAFGCFLYKLILNYQIQSVVCVCLIMCVCIYIPCSTWSSNFLALIILCSSLCVWGCACVHASWLLNVHCEEAQSGDFHCYHFGNNISCEYIVCVWFTVLTVCLTALAFSWQASVVGGFAAAVAGCTLHLFIIPSAADVVLSLMWQEEKVWLSYTKSRERTFSAHRPKQPSGRRRQKRCKGTTDGTVRKVNFKKSSAFQRAWWKGNVCASAARFSHTLTCTYTWINKDPNVNITQSFTHSGLVVLNVVDVGGGI